MEIMETIEEIAAFAEEEKRSGRGIALVPTMGALHEGHLSLVDKAKKLADTVVLSIFLNPTQFAQNEDLDKYPKTWNEDLNACENRGVDALFAPTSLEMYPDGPQSTWVIVEEITEFLCGASRPTHFRGVATVVAKLFNIVRPDVAVFGEKDYQQTLIIKKMVRELNFHVEIATAPIVREHDGLAMSSRNKLLTRENRKKAVAINKALDNAVKAAAQGTKDIDKLKNAISRTIEESGATLDYVEISDAETLTPLKRLDKTAVAAVAAKYGDVRLIDNAILKHGI
jgi:pantoate--beta-alanine ligase